MKAEVNFNAKPNLLWLCLNDDRGLLKVEAESPRASFYESLAASCFSKSENQAEHLVSNCTVNSKYFLLLHVLPASEK